MKVPIEISCGDNPCLHFTLEGKVRGEDEGVKRGDYAHVRAED